MKTQIKNISLNIFKKFKECKNRNKKIFLFSISLWIIIAGFQFFQRDDLNNNDLSQNEKNEDEKSHELVSISAQLVKQDNIEKTFKTYSHLLAKQEVLLRPKTGITIKEVFVMPGDHVKKNQLLAVADSEMADLQKRLSSLEFSMTKQEYQVFAELAKKEYIAKTEYEQKKIGLESQKIRQRMMYLEGQSSQIISPIDGVVSEINMRVGDFIDDQNKFQIKIIDPNHFRLEVYLPLDTVSQIKIGEKVSLKRNVKNNFNEWLIEEGFAVVEAISPSIEPKTGNVYVQLVSTKTPEHWINGIDVQVEFSLSQKNNILALDNRSLIFEKGKSFVYRVIASENGSDMVEKVEVELGESDGIKSEIKKGLEEYDQIAIEGKSNLSDMVKVEISE